MPKRITHLTDVQRSRMESFAREWIDRGWRTGALSKDEWAVWESGARRCYEYAGLPFPAVVHVPNPLVGALAAPIAAYVLAELRTKGVIPKGPVGGAVDGAVRGAVGGAVDVAVRGAVGGAVGGAVRVAVGGAVDVAVRGAVGGAVGVAVDVAVDGAVGGAVGGAVDGAVGVAVRGAVGGAVDVAVRGAVDGAVDVAVRGAVGGAVGGAVDVAVRGAVGGAVRGAGYAKGLSATILKLWSSNFGGRIGGWSLYWSSIWYQSYVAFFRDVCELKLGGDLWERSRAFEDANSAGWWWPFRDFVMVVDAPVTMTIETAGGQHRLHNETGAAVAWADGWGVYSWHGTVVPSDLIEQGWDVERILREPNTEIRRCAIERMGWPEFIEAAGLKQVGESVADPGNPGYELALYDVPRQMFDAPIRILLCTNATVERDGTRRRFGLTVPAECREPIEAAGWTFGLDRTQYQTLQAAC